MPVIVPVSGFKLTIPSQSLQVQIPPFTVSCSTNVASTFIETVLVVLESGGGAGPTLITFVT